MASAKSEAMKRLGKEDDYINLKGLNNERKIAKSTYNTRSTAFQNAYNDLLADVANRRSGARVDFNKGRATVGENAYLQNRQNTADLASRGVSGGGLEQLGRLSNRIETGRQYSNLANTFYNTMSDIDATEKTGTNEYNTNVDMAKNELNAALADITAREKAGRNAYKMQVAQLAEQIQARRDAAAAAAAQLRLARQQAAQNKKNQNNSFNSRLFEIYGDNPNQQSYENAIKYYKQVKGGNTADAVKYLTKIGVGNGVGQPGIIGPTQPWVDYSNRTPKTTSNTLGKIVAKSTAGPTTNPLGNYIYNSLRSLWR